MVLTLVPRGLISAIHPMKKSFGQKIKKPRYQDRHRSARVRTKDLLSRMTLEEKAAQMMCVWQQKSDKLIDGQEHGQA